MALFGKSQVKETSSTVLDGAHQALELAKAEYARASVWAENERNSAQEAAARFLQVAAEKAAVKNEADQFVDHLS